MIVRAVDSGVIKIGTRISDCKSLASARFGSHAHPLESSGEIGLPCFRLIVRDPRLARIPLILETPTFEETAVWRREIEILYELQHVEGSPGDVAARLDEMTRAWRGELAEMRRVSGKGPKEKKTPKGKKGKQGDDDDEESEKPVKAKAKAKPKAAAKPKAGGKKKERAVEEELEHGEGTDSSELTEEDA